MSDLDLPPDNFDGFEGEGGGEFIPVQPPAATFHDPQFYSTGRQRRAYDGEVDKIQEALVGIYQAHAEYGEFQVEVKRLDKEENRYKTCGVYANLMEKTIPSPDEVGRKYGDGRFMVIARYTGKDKKRKADTFTIDLDEEYAKYRAAAIAAEKAAAAASRPANASLDTVTAVAELAKVAGVGSGGKDELLREVMQSRDSMTKTMFDVIKPQQSFTPQDMVALMGEFAKINQPKPDTGVELIVAMMKHQSESMQAMMMQSSQQNQNTMNMMLTLVTAIIGKQQPETQSDKMMLAILPKLLDSPKRDDSFAMMEKMIDLSKKLNGTEKEEDEQVNKIVDMVIQYAPQLLKSTIDAITVRQILKAYPDYSALMKNPALQGKVIEKLQESLPPEQLDVIMEKTGLGGGLDDYEESQPPPPRYAPPSSPPPQYTPPPQPQPRTAAAAAAASVSSPGVVTL